jgi:oligopeptide/dipeptide ABC transporter ATP-binding protein
MFLLEIKKLSKIYHGKNGARVRALSDVSLDIAAGEVVGVVGESGCGKSTLGRSLLRLIEPSSGQVIFEGKDIVPLKKSALKPIRRDLQIIFQDPFGSLNPRHKVGKVIAEPLEVHGIGSKQQRQEKVRELLDLVGLPQNAIDRHPHEFSGGQRQRIAIARALALDPKLIVADEAVSALDVSIQSQIINLIAKLQKQLNISILFISHDLSVIRHVSDRIAIMYLGRIVEMGETEEVMQNPQHPYTQSLLSAIPRVGEKRARTVLAGEVPDPANPPLGCAFHTRCSKAMDVCKQTRPELATQSQGAVACHLFPQ